LHAVTAELQEHLLAQERELDSREGAIVMWEEGFVAFAHTLGEVHAECDASSARADVIQWDFFTQAHASSSQSDQLTDLGRTMEECQILLFLQEIDLEVLEVILVEELERSPHPTDGRDLSTELDKAHACVGRIDNEHTTEAEQLSQRVVRISNFMVDLGLLPIHDITQLPKSARDVLPVVDLILNCLQ
jgi:hypothetical protein